MHLADENHVDRSIEGPAEFISTNVLGSFIHLLDHHGVGERLRTL